MKHRYLILFLALLSSLALRAQDVVLISEGNYVRGTIQGTNYASVILKTEDGKVSQYEATKIKEFIWNGQTYVSKPIIIKKKMEHRFFRLLEYGAANLYAIGGTDAGIDEPQPKAAPRVRPSIAIGGGSGGMGGLGGGVGISIGSGRRSEPGKQKQKMPESYFIEKPGTGPMIEIPVEGGNSESKNQHIKNALLQKLTNDEDLAERIKATENFDAKLIRAFVAAYNDMKK